MFKTWVIFALNNTATGKVHNCSDYVTFIIEISLILMHDWKYNRKI